MLIDTHCHLDFPDFSEDFSGMLARAEKANVGQMITISTRIHEFEKLRMIAEKYPNVFCTIGTHPHNSGDAAEDGITADEIFEIAKHPKVVGIGEAGLDYHYDRSPRDAQMRGFRTHIDAARKSGLPIVIHAREADKDIGDVLEDEMNKGAFTGVLHCFSSGIELARRGLKLGLYVSFSGIVTFKNAKEVQAAAMETPDDRILIETDAPYLAPMPHRGQRNEPAYVAHTAQFLADLKRKNLDEMAHLTTENALRLFSKMPRVVR
ncbi:MAG: TatD family hydrolase [Pseudomonadota bacterium]